MSRFSMGPITMHLKLFYNDLFEMILTLQVLSYDPYLWNSAQESGIEFYFMLPSLFSFIITLFLKLYSKVVPKLV